jgi:kynurenine 3-monooxygenase
MSKVTIIGAGLSGSLLAIYLAKRGIECDVYEARGDMRKETVAAGRSINLALSNRGIAALKEVGLDEYMLREAVPMHGRMIHAVDGQTKLLPYSGRKGEYINSVSRSGLNIALINEAEKYKEVKFHFHQRCGGFDFSAGVALMENTETGQLSGVKADTAIGTDGAGSAIRNAMRVKMPDFQFSEEWLEHGYKELHIPPDFGLGIGDSRLAFNALHIWARHSFMMIALPNFDGSFTCTLFLAHKGENSFEEIINHGYTRIDKKDKTDKSDLSSAPDLCSSVVKNSLMDFFEDNFPDAIPLMPSLVEDFFTNPTGNLGTIKCYPWNVGGKSLLIGDSAHAIVPFYGQGMNCSFEDCRVLNQLIGEHGTDWERVYTEFVELRKVNADAIADMAVDNFYEMRDAVADPVFQRKRELETRLEQTFPDYFSKYSMVTFREDMPYSEAMRRGRAQDKFLMEVCENATDVSKIDLKDLLDKVRISTL